MKTPNKVKFGVHTNDFFPEGRENAESFECVFCQLVSTKNYCLSCNHCICKDCLNNGIKGEKCPKDGKTIIKGINSFGSILIGKTLLNKLKIRCIFYKNNCPWCGPFEEFENSHLKQCKFKNKSNASYMDIENKNKSENNNIDKPNLLERKNENYNYFANDIEDKNNEIDSNSEKKDYQDNNNLLKKKRNIFDDDKKSISILDVLGNKETFKEKKYFDINGSNSSSFYSMNDKYKKDFLLPEGSFDDDISYYNSLNSSLYDENEIINNNIIIDEKITLNNFPYYYYFTTPLVNSFSCSINVISRNILKNDDDISFGLTNINNNDYTEILSVKNNNFIFYKGDIIIISYDKDIFLFYFEKDKNNRITIPFNNNESIRYYPTIIINNKDDILEVFHD